MTSLTCGRTRWYWPWFCTRDFNHDGPCALARRWF